MLEEYLNVITKIENYVDGILVVDRYARVVYINIFDVNYFPFKVNAAIGKTLYELFQDMTPETSVIAETLRTGKPVLNKEAVMHPKGGREYRIIASTFPIREDGRIIGAVNIVNYPDRERVKKGLEVYADQSRTSKKLYQVSDIIGRHPSMYDIRQQILKTSMTTSSVLIYGPTGSGKELVAQAIHSAGVRKEKPFVSQNCTAIPEPLLESIFFGTTKGSYTGAVERGGLFENANGGTVFLDEINSMDLRLQAKLLRVLEERKVTRIGSSVERDVDVRIIAATNRPPRECVEDGSLRPDLFYRLSGAMIVLPRLKDRGNDVELLTEYFVSKYNAAMHKNIMGVSQDVMNILRRYSWPGNVRELRNAIEGAFNFCDNRIIGIGDLPAYIVSETEGVDPEILQSGSNEMRIPWRGSLKDTMDAIEGDLINAAVQEYKTLNEAAEYLGITRQTLYHKLEKYRIPDS